MTHTMTHRSDASLRAARDDLVDVAPKVHSFVVMELTTYRVRPLVRGWKVEANDANVPSTVRESKSDAMHLAHSRARGTPHQIVVLDENGTIESVFPPVDDQPEGA